jgi:glutaconyl-CoA decarboxylase
MRITVENHTYEVEVEVLDETLKPNAAPAHAAAPAPTQPSPPRPATPARAQPAAPQAAIPDAAGAATNADTEVKSPLAGSVLAIAVKPGDIVSTGDTLLVLEAMKMESPVASPRDGTIAEVKVSSGEAVKAGQPLVTFG